MIMTLSDDRVREVVTSQLEFRDPFAEPTVEMDGRVFQVYEGRWWVTTGEGKIVFRQRRPMCNRQQAIASSLRDSLSQKTGLVLTAAFIPMVLVDVTDLIVDHG
jgi:hypothetical protein